MAGNYKRTGRLDTRAPDEVPVGHKFGNWSFVSAESPSRYRVVCGCGVQRTVRAQDLKLGKSPSCGCRGMGYAPHTAGGDLKRTHGTDYGDKVYRAWRAAKNRVFNPKAEKFEIYGERGMSMHPDWVNSFETFRDYVGPAPTPAHSLDRIDPNRGYEPGNVRWATATQQVNNRRSSPRVVLEGGVSLSVHDVCHELGISFKEAKAYIKAGGSVENFFKSKGIKNVGSQ